ncbi:MAG: YabP/YqfC family sporulation protein [Candidatus Caccovivens sp.]
MFNFFNEIKGNLKNNFDSFNLVNISGALLYVEGHLGLVTLSKELISFKVKGGVIMVEGRDMILAELNENTIKITGTIKKVEQL